MRTALAWLVLALPAAADVTREDLKKLAAAGVSDGVILAYCKANAPVTALSADDVVELKQAGLSEGVLAALLTAPEPAPAPVAGPAVVLPAEEPVVYETAPAPLYVSAETSPYYYYGPSYWPSVSLGFRWSSSSSWCSPSYSPYCPPKYGSSCPPRGSVGTSCPPKPGKPPVAACPPSSGGGGVKPPPRPGPKPPGHGGGGGGVKPPPRDCPKPVSQGGGRPSGGHGGGRPSGGGGKPGGGRR